MKKRHKKSIWDLLLVIAGLVFLFSAVSLYRETGDYREGKAEYKELEEEVIEEKETKKGKSFTVNFEKLQKMNKDVVGWIRFDAPKVINYPVVQTVDNETYLTKTVDGSRNKVGAIFMDKSNARDFQGQHTVLYGHNMKDGSMFAGLAKYKKESYYREHPYFYIYTPDGKVRTYKICSVEITESDSKSYQMEFADEKEYENYLQLITENSLYPATAAKKEASVVSLSTCTNVKESQRLVVHGILQKEE